MAKDIVFKTLMLKGEAGSSVSSFEKTGTVGNIDTYTIHFSDGTSATFEVTNGSSIESIERTGTSGATDTYTITLTNGDTSTFEVTNGLSYEVPKDGVILYDGNSAPAGYEIITNPLTGATTSLNFAKKVSATEVSGRGEIIDSFNTGDDKHTNAPSLQAVIDRTDNNLLFNSEFVAKTRGSGITDNTKGVGWVHPTSLFQFGDNGLKIMSGLSLSNVKLTSPYWYGSNVDSPASVGFDYVTLSVAYRAGTSGAWTQVSKTFNCTTMTPATATLFTLNGCTVTANIFASGRVEFTFSNNPSSDFYIGLIKLERGTSRTDYSPSLHDKNSIQAAEDLDDIVRADIAADISQAVNDLTALIDALYYQVGDQELVDFYGGSYTTYSSDTNRLYIQATIPLKKPIASDVTSVAMTVNHLYFGDVTTYGDLKNKITSSSAVISHGLLEVQFTVDTTSLPTTNIDLINGITANLYFEFGDD